jgi:hypothetical protein
LKSELIKNAAVWLLASAWGSKSRDVTVWLIGVIDYKHSRRSRCKNEYKHWLPAFQEVNFTRSAVNEG